MNDIDAETDHSDLRVMSTDECTGRLATAGMGRVAFLSSGEVVVLPVHHVVHGLDVYFRTSGGSKIQVAADNSPVGLEVHEYDRSSVTGWSVSLSGTASLVDEDDLIATLEGSDSTPWKVGDQNDSVWVRIRPDQISGRELLPR